MPAARAQKLLEAYQRLSRREQWLVIATAAVIAAFAAMRIVGGAFAQLDRLDARIDALQTDIVNYSHQITRKQSVEAQYRQVASQHSSAWTQAEIHDRLRQEIYRLAERMPPPLDENGIPASTTTGEGKLIEIPAIGQGILLETDDGFREYRLSVQIPDANLQDLVDYLDRLQVSPQSLRIDALDLVRNPAGETVTAKLEIARIVAGGAIEAGRGDAAAAPEAADAGRIDLAEWSCEGCEAALDDAPEGGGALLATAGAQGGALFAERNLVAGATYEMAFELTSQGEGQLGIAAAGADAFLPGDVPIAAGSARRYRIQFTVPEGKGGRMRVNAPMVRLDQPGATVRLAAVTLERIDG